jgi:hypothetical protein
MLWLPGDGDGHAEAKGTDAGPLPRGVLYALRDQQTPSGSETSCVMESAHSSV